MIVRAKRKALVILSGGQDSTTCLLWARHNYDEVHCLTFDYGQKHRVEIEAAKAIAALLGACSHTVLNVAGMLKGRSPLVNPDVPLETYTDYASMDKTIGNRVELTFVPLRNLLFLVIAGNHALAKDCNALVTGVCAMDNANYPDCTEAFIQSAEYTMREALGMHRPEFIFSKNEQLEIVTPLLHLSKAETINMAKMYHNWEEAYSLSHTCYAGEVPPCGKCHACVLRAEGFREAGVADPLVMKWAVIRTNAKAADFRSHFNPFGATSLNSLADRVLAEARKHQLWSTHAADVIRKLATEMVPTEIEWAVMEPIGNDPVLVFTGYPHVQDEGSHPD